MKKGTILLAAAVLSGTFLSGIYVAKRQEASHSDRGRGGDGSVRDTAAHPAELMYHCAMHPNYISDKPGNCPICGMKLVPISADDHGAAHGVHIDPTTVQNMGVRTEIVMMRDLKSEIRASGTVKADEGRLFQVNARVMGYVESLQAKVTGEKVRKGQALMEIYSPDLVGTQEEFLQALRYSQGTSGNPAASGKPDAAGSRDLAESARRRLLNWGVSAADIDALEKSGHARNTLPISSPGGGVVLEKMVVAGQNITPGMPLYKIADLTKVWVVAEIYQRDLASVKAGADAEVELSYLQGKPFRGRVAFISPVLDEQTKTAEVRIEVPNTPALDLKPGMFATVTLRSASARAGLAVPEQAVIRSGRRNLAVIATGGGYFEPREIRLGTASGGYVEVLDGIREGERIVVSSQFLIDSESNLRSAVQELQSIPKADSLQGNIPDTGNLPVTGNGK